MNGVNFCSITGTHRTLDVILGATVGFSKWQSFVLIVNIYCCCFVAYYTKLQYYNEF